MKTAVVFLLVALSCCFDSSVASKTHGKQTHPTQSIVPRDCIMALLKSSLPNTLMRLQEMLCCFANAQKTKNAMLYKKFLIELHQLLKDAGCTVDELLKLEGTVEQLGDKVGDICKCIVQEVLCAVEDLGLSEPLFKVLCDLAGETLVKLSEALKSLDLKIVTGITGQIGLGGKGSLLGLGLL